MRSCGFHLRAILQEMPQVCILDLSLKITNLRLQLHLPGANELTYLFLKFLKLSIISNLFFQIDDFV